MQQKTTGSRSSAASHAVTIMLQPSHRAILRDALLDELGLQAERLDQALTHADRLAHQQSLRGPCNQIVRMAAVLDEVGWGNPLGAGKITVGLDCRFVLARTALRNLLDCAEENMKDARTYGNSKEVQSASACLQATSQTLRAIEQQAKGTRKAA